MLKKMLDKHASMKEKGFTLIELLVVIVIIGVLAAIALPIFMNQQRAAHNAASVSSIRQLREAVEIGRMKTGKTLFGITGNGCTGCAISTTDPLTLPKTHASWANYAITLKRISDASGIDVNGIVDGYGRPISIDENEGDNGSCSRDTLASIKDPYTSNIGENIVRISLTSPCA